MNGHKLCAVWERGLNLNVVDHFRNALHDVIAGDDMGARLHQVSNGSAIPRAFHDEIRDQGDGFWMVVLQSTTGHNELPWRPAICPFPVVSGSCLRPPICSIPLVGSVPLAEPSGVIRRRNVRLSGATNRITKHLPVSLTPKETPADVSFPWAWRIPSAIHRPASGNGVLNSQERFSKNVRHPGTRQPDPERPLARRCQSPQYRPMKFLL